MALDFEKNGALHEYYNPETGEGIFNKGFSSWNLLGFNMMEYLDGKEVIEEFLCKNTNYNKSPRLKPRG